MGGAGWVIRRLWPRSPRVIHRGKLLFFGEPFGLQVARNRRADRARSSEETRPMKRILLALIITAGAIISGGRAYAHHSFAATYLEDRMQKVDGKIVQFLFRNPH